MDQDMESGLYFMIAYLGSKGERISMLVDTMADGTAVKYEID
jgi:hypothetical protein